MKQKLSALIRIALQIGAFIVFWQAGNLIVRWLALPLPGSIVGLGLLLLLLVLKIIPPAWLETGTNLLLSEMLLFFVPAVIGVMKYAQLLLSSGWRILLAIAASVVVAMAVAGLLVEAIVRLREKNQ
jgi:holin-like protein